MSRRIINKDYGTHRHLFDIDVSHLAEQVSKFHKSDWHQWSFRQNRLNVQQSTRTIPYIWGWKPHNRHRDEWPVIEQIMHRLEDHLGGKAFNCILAMLPAKSNITPHTDINDLRYIHRCHWPIITNPDCFFLVEGERVLSEPGVGIEINNQRTHGVMNASNQDRVHLIIDIWPEGDD